jgi:hypothetical protein
MGTFAGGKITRSHSTAIEAAEPIIRAAERQPEVSKIALHRIVSGTKNGQHGLKFAPINGGLKVTVRGPRSLQELFIYTSDPERTKTALFAAQR